MAYPPWRTQPWAFNQQYPNFAYRQVAMRPMVGLWPTTARSYAIPHTTMPARQAPTMPMQAQAPRWPGWPMQLPPSPAAAPSAPRPEQSTVSTSAFAPKAATQPLASPSDFTASDLSQADVDLLVSLFGEDLENVYDLSAGQRWMLDQSDRADSAFFLQVLLTATIHIDPPTFRRHVDSVSNKRDSLRSAFVTQGTSKPLRVVLKNRRVEILFLDISEESPERQDELLEEHVEADRRRGFDLVNDALLRIACYKRSDEDLFALLVSQPHIDSDGTSLMLLLKDIFMPFMGVGADLMFGQRQEQVSDRAYGEWLNNRDTTSELAYWQDTLATLPSFEALPGHNPTGLSYTRRTWTITLDERLSHKLVALQGKTGATIANIMQAAWSAMVMGIRDTNDITYGLVTAGRDAQMADSLQLTGGFINVLPMRVHANKSPVFSDVLRIVSQRQLEALQASHCSIREIQEALGRSDELFDHLLNFQNFSSPTSSGPGVGTQGRGFDLKTFDNLSEDLCVYFVNRKNAIVCNFSYNGSAFIKESIQLLADSYQKVLTQIAESEGSIAIASLTCPSLEDFERLAQRREAVLLRIAAQMRKVKAFDGLEDAVLLNILQRSQVRNYQESDLILPPDQTPRGVLFVLSGMVEYRGVNRMGWTVPLRIIGDGQLITAKALWQTSQQTDVTKRNERSVRVLSDGTSVLQVSPETCMRLIAQHPQFAVNLMEELDASKTIVERLWMTY